MISEPALDRLSAMFQGPDVTGTRYQLISVLGRGGMGIVYLARDTVLEREVALKIVERPSDEANEARILARLEHPGIVPVHDFGELPDGRLFYAMKRVRGDRLDRWMATERDLDQRLGVFLRVCETVAFAHAHGVIHLDLKPENVMVGEFGEVLVLDWGVAQLRIADCGLRIQTDGAIVGTPYYMAPEQARGDAAVDHRADVFALGAMLESIASPAPVLAIARKARSPEAAARYQDVQALAADVSRFLAGRAVEAHRERLVDRLARFGRRVPPADTAGAHLPRGPPVVPLGDAFLASSILAARTRNGRGGGILVKRVMFATLLGGFLGIFDGLTSWFTPAVRDQLGGIVIGSTAKGLVAAC